MNVPKAIELSLAKMYRTCAELGESVTIRAWQSLDYDGTWDEAKDRSWPMLEIRCSPQRTEETQVNLSCDAAILLGTKTDDDKSHAVISAMLDEVQACTDRLFAQFRRTSGTEYAQFIASMTEHCPTGFDFGGFTYGDGLAPYDNGGINMVGITLRVHWTRSDF